MAITKLTVYTGQVPLVGQTQIDFDTNTGDILQFITSFVPDVNLRVDEFNAIDTNITNASTTTLANATAAATSEANALQYATDSTTAVSALSVGTINDAITSYVDTWSSFKLNQSLSGIMPSPTITIDSGVQELNTLPATINDFDVKTTYFITADSGTISNYNPATGYFEYTAYDLPSTSNGIDTINVYYVSGSMVSSVLNHEIDVLYAPSIIDESITDLEWDDNLSSNTTGDFPAGIILFGTDTFGGKATQYDGGDNAFATKGASYTTIGVDNGGTFDVSSSSSGSHAHANKADGSNFNHYYTAGGSQYAYTNPDAANSGGTHSHTVQITDIVPDGYVFNTVKTINNITTIDFLKAITLNSSTQITHIYSDFDDNVIKSGLTEQVSPASKTTVVSTSGDHFHSPSPVTRSGDGSATVFGTSKGAHTHTDGSIVFTVSSEIISVAIGMFYKSVASAGDIYGVIDSDTIPKGWIVCDGTNGTIDSTDKILKHDNALIGTTSGTHSMTCSGSISDTIADHTHATATIASGTGGYNWYGYYALGWAHSHTLSSTQSLRSKANVINLIKKVHA